MFNKFAIEIFGVPNPAHGLVPIKICEHERHGEYI